MQIQYSKLPGFNQIFLDYIYNFKKISGFYNYDFKDKESFIKAALEKKETYPLKMNFSREDIAVILKRQNKFFNSAEITFENIEYFKNSNTFAVVTGQQVGMLSGNYYTILKAINTIQLAKQLSETYPELKFVPVFWLESEDHDFLEANHVNIINKQNKPLEISYYENGEEKEKYLKSVVETITFIKKNPEIPIIIIDDFNIEGSTVGETWRSELNKKYYITYTFYV